MRCALPLLLACSSVLASDPADRLETAFRSEIRAAVQAGNLAQARELFAQWDAYDATGQLPTNPAMRSAVTAAKRTAGTTPSPRAIAAAKQVAAQEFATLDGRARVLSLDNWRILDPTPTAYEGRQWILWGADCLVSTGDRYPRAKQLRCYVSGDAAQGEGLIGLDALTAEAARRFPAPPVPEPRTDAPRYPGGSRK